MTTASSSSTKSRLKRQPNCGGFDEALTSIPATVALLDEGSLPPAATSSSGHCRGPLRGPSSDSQQSRNSLQVPGSLTTTPLVQHRTMVGKRGASNGSQLVHQYSDSTTGGTRSDNNTTGSKRERFKWSGVVVSFDADSVKIENEVNGAPPGIKTIGKEVCALKINSFLKQLFISFFFDELFMVSLAIIKRRDHL